MDWEEFSGWHDPVIPETVDVHEVQDEDTQDLEALLYEEIAVDDDEEEVDRVPPYKAGLGMHEELPIDEDEEPDHE